MVTAQKWTLSKKFVGEPKESDIILVTEELPDIPGDGEVLCEALWLTVDPYMRPVSAHMLKEGDVIMGGQVARVLESKNEKFPKGTHVLAFLGWRSHSLVKDDSILEKVPEMGDRPLSLALGILGMPGLTAYFGFLDKCRPKEGEVVLVNTAAGTVGSAVGQIAKIKGCTVIAFAGTEEKCTWLKKELGFDHVFNYKCINLDKVLSTVAPGGVDCYFDNVGGDFTATVLEHMNTNGGRVCLCGTISNYNIERDSLPKGPYPFGTILWKQLSVQGFMVTSYKHRYTEGRKQMLEWLDCGKLKYRETITDGFENMPAAFFGLFKGNNIGKAIVKA